MAASRLRPARTILVALALLDLLARGLSAQSAAPASPPGQEPTPTFRSGVQYV